jgi:hypothetical protein
MERTPMYQGSFPDRHKACQANKRQLKNKLFTYE